MYNSWLCISIEFIKWSLFNCAILLLLFISIQLNRKIPGLSNHLIKNYQLWVLVTFGKLKTMESSHRGEDGKVNHQEDTYHLKAPEIFLRMEINVFSHVVIRRTELPPFFPALLQKIHLISITESKLHFSFPGFLF